MTLPPGSPRRSSRARTEHGFVVPTRLLALCISGVAMAALVLIANNPDQAPADEATPARTTPSKAPSTTPAQPQAPKPRAKPIKRGQVNVEIFNNTPVKGMAGGVATKAKNAGWNVVGADNWYGTVDGSTVYFPPRLKAAAQALGRDLGIKKVKVAEDPMRMDRLTVILTSDYHS